MKDEPPKHHIVATAGLLQRWLINNKERAKTVLSTSLDRQKSSSAQLADNKRLKELGPFQAAHVFFFLFFSVNETTSELGMIAARTRQNMRVRGADASWE